MKTPLKITSLISITIMLCLPGPAWLSASRPASRCINGFAEGSGPLSAVPFGLAPASIVFGDIPGLLSSVVTGLETSGAKGQGALHLTLHHTFVSTDPARPGSFTTDDRAVCAPAGTDPNVCHVNDVLQIVSGTGIFANADGSLRNHAILDLNSFTLTFSIRGRVCGDGL
jgi:hypothetical protein